MDDRPKTMLEILEECDNFPRPSLDAPNLYPATLASLYTLHLSSHPTTPLGYLLPTTASTFANLPSWTLSPTHRTLTLTSPDPPNEQTLTTLLAATTTAMRATTAFPLLTNCWHDDLAPIHAPNNGPLLFRLERAALPLFGLPSTSVVLLLTVRSTPSSPPRIWIPRRARTKRAYPNALDATVVTGLRAHETARDAVIRAAGSEAALSPELVGARARPVGAVSTWRWLDERAGGGDGAALPFPETQIVWELELGAEEAVVPRPGDDEVEGVAVMEAEEVRAAVGRGEFRPSAAVVMVDFLVRHGVVTAENEGGYAEVVGRLHRRLPFGGPAGVPRGPVVVERREGADPEKAG